MTYSGKINVFTQIPWDKGYESVVSVTCENKEIFDQICTGMVRGSKIFRSAKEVGKKEKVRLIREVGISKLSSDTGSPEVWGKGI